MTPRDISTWLQEEHARVAECTYEVQKALAIPPGGAGGTWIPQIRDRFGRLASHMRSHMTIEETGGYMKDVMKHRPTLSPKVEKLLHEHRELDRLMRDIEMSLSDLTPEDTLLIRHATARIGMFLSYVEHHKHEEENLVLYAFTMDLGAGD